MYFVIFNLSTSTPKDLITYA